MVISNMAPEADGGSPVAAGPARGCGTSRPRRVMSTYITRGRPARTTWSATSTTASRWASFCRQSLAAVPGPRRDLRDHPAGLRLLPRAVRHARTRSASTTSSSCPSSRQGAMENAGAVTFLEDYVFRSRVTDFAREARGETILHEMAHMWFGDLVTMRWWDDLWLNESFATWAGTVAQAEATRWTSRLDDVRAASTRRGRTGRTSCRRPTRSPPTSRTSHAVEVNFDGITYAKGASVLKQLVAYVGPGQLPGRACGVLRRARVGQRHARRPAVARWRRPPGRDLTAWSRAVAGDRRA